MPPVGRHPCQDCETGACPCGARCSGCEYTGDCQSCRGTSFVEGPPPSPVAPTMRGTVRALPTRRRTINYPATRKTASSPLDFRPIRIPDMPPDPREVRCSPYTGTLRRRTQNGRSGNWTRVREYCATCGRRDRNETGAWYVGLTVEQRHAHLNARDDTRAYLRCLGCGRAFKDMTTQWARNALERGGLTRWYTDKLGRYRFDVLEPDSRVDKPA